jgi:MFS family permease
MAMKNLVTGTGFDSKAFRRSRLAYLLECAFEYFVALLVSDVFLVKVLKDIGMSDANIGIISTLVALAFLFQLLSIAVVQCISNTKFFATTLHLIGQLLFMGIYLIPFLPAVSGSKYRQVLVVVCMLLAYLGNYLVQPMIYKWGNSFVEPRKRGVYSATKEMISLLSGIVITLISGYVIDYFEAKGNLHGGFIFAACGICIFSLCDLVCLLLMRGEDTEKDEMFLEAVPMREVLRGTLGNKSFLSVVLLACLWNGAVYASVGFFGTYRLNPHELALTVGGVQLINTLGNLSRFGLSRPFGRYADKHSFASAIELAMAIGVAAFVVSAITVPGSPVMVWSLVILFSILYHGCNAGTNANMINIIYNFVDERYFMQAVALKNSIAGLFGFCVSLLAGRLLSYVQANGNTFLGFSVYGQQVLSVVSILFLLPAIALVHFVISKQQRTIQ